MGKLTREVLPAAGFRSDISKGNLRSQNQMLRNIRLVKDNELEASPGYREVISGLNIGNKMHEFTDDLSGDRFLLYQDGTSIKRIDYDEGDGNGYENETPQTLTLPAGVTIASGAHLRFFYHNGVVRISGASEPLWYGYIDRTVMAGSWRPTGQDSSNYFIPDTFLSTTGGFSGNNATLSVYDCTTPMNPYGLADACAGANALLVQQTQWNGCAYKQVTMEANILSRLLVMSFRPVTTPGSATVRIGSTIGGDEYGESTTDTNGEWIKHDFEFTPTGTAVYISLIPGLEASNDIAFFDYVLCEQSAAITLQGWYLETASLAPLEGGVSGGHNIFHYSPAKDEYSYYARIRMQYDQSQFALGYDLPSDLFLTSEFTRAQNFYGTTLSLYDIYLAPAAGFSSKEEALGGHRRVTKIFSALAYVAKSFTGGLPEDQLVYYKDDDIDLTEQEDDFVFLATTWAYETVVTGDKNRIWMSTNYATEEPDLGAFLCRKGMRVKLYNNDTGASLETVITNFAYDLTYGYYIEIAHPLYQSGFISSDIQQTLGGSVGVQVSVERKTIFNDDYGYIFQMAVSQELLVDTIADFTDTPAGTESNTPNYSHYTIANKRAFCLPLADDKRDEVLFSPIGQFDNFPEGNVIQTEIGDADYNICLVTRDNRVTIFKRKSYSQVQYAGDTYYEDVGIAQNGLYATDGWMVKDDVLFYLAQDDCYYTTGGRPQALLGDGKVREFYRQHLSTSSFITYNKKEHEIWIYLSAGYILVFQEDFGQWYVRTVPGTMTRGFLTYDNDLFLFSSTKVVNFTHGLSSWDEAVTPYLKSLLTLVTGPGEYSKLSHMDLIVSGPVGLSITCSDPDLVENGDSAATGSVTPNATEPGPARYRPNYLCRQLEIELQASAASYSNNMRLRDSVLNFEVFDDGR